MRKEINEVMQYVINNVQNFKERYDNAIYLMNSNKWKSSLYTADMQLYKEIADTMYDYYLNLHLIENYQMPHTPEDFFGIYREIYGLPPVKKMSNQSKDNRQ